MSTENLTVASLERAAAELQSIDLRTLKASRAAVKEARTNVQVAIREAKREQKAREVTERELASV